MWPAISQWAHVEFFYKVPIKVATGYFVKELPGFFHNFFCNESYYAPKPLIESFFKKCSGVLFNVFTMYSQFS